MAIQFVCAGCKQPIEVDAEWANQTIMCPYCRFVQTAPAESTFKPEAVHPAAPVQPGGFGMSAPPPPSGAAVYVPQPYVPQGNPLGKASLILGVLAWLFLVVSIMAASPLFREMAGTLQPYLTSQPTAQAQRELTREFEERIQKEMMNNPAFQSRALQATLFILAAEVCGLTGVILSIVALFRRGAVKTHAILGIVFSGLFLPGQCIAFAVAMQMMLM